MLEARLTILDKRIRLEEVMLITSAGASRGNFSKLGYQVGSGKKEK
jgi:hypothetical protein